MKSPDSRRWFPAQQNTVAVRRGARMPNRRRHVPFERLEQRIALSLTPMVLDINTNTPSAEVANIVSVGSTAFFIADDGIHGSELWTSDRTESGTRIVKDIHPGAGSGLAKTRFMTNVGGTLFFTADNGSSGNELWKSDGTEAGTMLVKDIAAGASHSYPVDLINVNGTLFFLASDATHWLGLWKSDGTDAGTVLVKHFDTYNGITQTSLTNVDGTLYFTADDGVHGIELWKSDGTTEGTTLVKDIRPGDEGGYPFHSNPHDLTSVGGTLFFRAYTDTHGHELWKSDGTVAGTVMVKDILATAFTDGSLYSGYPIHLTDVDGTLYFSAVDSTHGWELWKSDGTADGTVLVKDVNPYDGPGNGSVGSSRVDLQACKLEYSIVSPK